MLTSPELVALIQQERERSIAHDRLVRLAGRVRRLLRPVARRACRPRAPAVARRLLTPLAC